MKNVALIRANWFDDIVGQCADAFINNLDKNYKAEVFHVPGGLEIPLKAKQLALTNRYEAICCSAFVVDGGIYRHEFVCNAILQGIMSVQLETLIPVLSAVLTPKQTFNEDDPKEHKFFFDHMSIKGKELANACNLILKSN